MNDIYKVRPDTPDDENPEWTTEDLKNARKAPAYFGPERLARLIGRPLSPPEKRKVVTTIRLDPDVLEAIKATGKGWQTRLNQELRERYVLAKERL